MEEEKVCKIKECYSAHRCQIVGIVFLVLATILTLTTLSGLGILGMFVVGLVMCCHKHFGREKCQCGCSCCSTSSECSTPPKKPMDPMNKL